jgi:translation initiation factor 2B subunit (eIF-2B alpha/beta/delta family)
MVKSKVTNLKSPEDDGHVKRAIKQMQYFEETRQKVESAIQSEYRMAPTDEIKTLIGQLYQSWLYDNATSDMLRFGSVLFRDVVKQTAQKAIDRINQFEELEKPVEAPPATE